jgi:hypothetical protein
MNPCAQYQIYLQVSCRPLKTLRGEKVLAKPFDPIILRALRILSVIVHSQSLVVEGLIRFLSLVCFIRIPFPLEWFPFLAIVAAHDFFNFISCFVLIAINIITKLICFVRKYWCRSNRIVGKSIQFDE